MAKTRRLPTWAEKELAKLLGTLGYRDYGRLLWDLPPARASAGTPVLLEPSIVPQVLDQARHDASVVAYGPAALPNLPRCRRDLPSTNGISAAALLDGIGSPVEVVLIVARIDAATRTTVAGCLAATRRAGAKSFAIIVTDEAGPTADDHELGADVQLVFWHDRYGRDGGWPARHLALLVHALGAAVIIALPGVLASETLGTYGRALANFHTLLTVPDMPVPGSLFTGIHHLRRMAPHATVLARDAAAADAVRASIEGLEGPGVAVLAAESVSAIVGDSFVDRRSAAGRAAIARILGGPSGCIALKSEAETTAGGVDVTATIVLHRERELAVPALASFRDMIEAARRDGIVVEARALLDKVDDATRRLVRKHGAFLDEIREVAFGDLASVRNEGARTARGSYLAFLDGDDLWGADWLRKAFRASQGTADPARTVWHPEALLEFFASDCDRAAAGETPDEGARTIFLVQQSDDDPTFEPRDLLFANLWSANVFAARALHLRFPYRPDDWSRQIGIEDWRFNLDTLGRGLRHVVVPGTVHLIRMKETGSLGQVHDEKATLPLLD